MAKTWLLLFFGFVSVIGWFTGKVFDICVKSKYCKECEYWEKKKNTAEYEEWHALHQPHCKSNHSGNAGKMEPDAVVEMFSRSEAMHGVRYAHYMGDGDSKTHKSIVDAKPYGDFTVTKKRVHRARTKKTWNTTEKSEKKRLKILAVEVC